MSKFSLFKTSSVIVLLTVACAIVFPIGILFISQLGSTIAYLLAIPFLILIGGLVFRGYQGLAQSPDKRSSTFIKTGIYLAPVVGVVSGIVAYLDNRHQVGYLFWYPFVVTLSLETMLGYISKLSSKKYSHRLSEKQTREVFVPLEPESAIPKLSIASTVQQSTSVNIDHPQPQAERTGITNSNIKPSDLTEQTTHQSHHWLWVVVAAIVFLIVAIIISGMVSEANNNSHITQLKRDYASAVVACGHKPIVVQQTPGIASTLVYHAYSPDNNDVYEFVLFQWSSSDKTVGYFCTLQEAQQKYKELL